MRARHSHAHSSESTDRCNTGPRPDARCERPPCLTEARYCNCKSALLIKSTTTALGRHRLTLRSPSTPRFTDRIRRLKPGRLKRTHRCPRQLYRIATSATRRNPGSSTPAARRCRRETTCALVESYRSASVPMRPAISPDGLAVRRSRRARNGRDVQGVRVVEAIGRFSPGSLAPAVKNLTRRPIGPSRGGRHDRRRSIRADWCVCSGNRHTQGGCRRKKGGRAGFRSPDSRLAGGSGGFPKEYETP